MTDVTSVAMSDAEERRLQKRQRLQLKNVKKLLVAIDADGTMIDAIDQALLDNEMW